jgi:L-lysine exporter family protein LysE/ArgO
MLVRRLGLVTLFPLLSGFMTGATLIVAIGAQNAFVLRQGLRREHVLAVVAVCAVSDIALIALGVAGVGALVEAAPLALTIVTIAGAVFLLAYAAFAARRAMRPKGLETGVATKSTLARATLTAVALTWLNPHVYLDTVLLLGSLAATHGPDGKWLFAIGAATASVVWFSALGYGARLLSRVFARPLAWRILDGIIAVVMAAIAVMLLLRLL